MTTGTVIPKRSDKRPIKMLQRPKHTIVSVYGSDAAPRATPNSVCTAGSATTTDHMPTPPMVDSVSVTTKRSQASADSISPGTWCAATLVEVIFVSPRQFFCLLFEEVIVPLPFERSDGSSTIR